jgi:hypothetical protein
VFLLGAVALSASFGSQLRAAEGHDFVLSQDDGYGVSDCMKPGMACGHVIADAWCEAHGQGHAEAYGLADDITGATKISTGAPATPVPPPGSVLIHCGD